MTRLVLAAVVVLLLLPATAHAEYVVTTTDDGNDGACEQPPTGDCTLREALAAPRPPDNTIEVPAGGYIIESALSIGSDVTIIGAGARATTIRRDEQTTGRVLFVDSLAAVDLSGVRISGGNDSSLPGGGILVEAGGELHLADSAVEGNTADRGGGIFSSGTLVVTRSTIARNNAVGDVTGLGGGIHVGGGSAALENSTISGNSADVRGGGIYTNSNLDLTNVTIADNFAGQGETGDGGGLHQAFGSSPTLRTAATNTLWARNIGGNCAGTVDHEVQSANGMSDDALCLFDGPDNQVVADTGLDFLSNNGGGTDTHALQYDSPGASRPGRRRAWRPTSAARSGPRAAAATSARSRRSPPATLIVKTAVDGASGYPEDFTIRVTQRRVRRDPAAAGQRNPGGRHVPDPGRHVPARRGGRPRIRGVPRARAAPATSSSSRTRSRRARSRSPAPRRRTTASCSRATRPGARTSTGGSTSCCSTDTRGYVQNSALFGPGPGRPRSL